MARNGCSSSPRRRWGARNGRSSPLGSAGALETTARTRSAPLGRSKWPLEPARLRWGARNGSSSPLGSAGALEMAARTRSALLGRSKWTLEPARLRWGARHGRSSPLGSAEALGQTEPNENKPNQTGQAYPETLHWAGPRMPVALNTETNILVHGMHGYALVYIYIYIYY